MSSGNYSNWIFKPMTRPLQTREQRKAYSHFFVLKSWWKQSWALCEMETRPCPQGELVPKGLLLLQRLEIFYVKQQGALEKQLDPGR